MDFLGVGPLEFLLVALIAFLVLGPKELQKTGKSIGRGLNKLIRSDTWKTVRQASEKVRSFPNDLIREAGIEEMKQSLDNNRIAPGKKGPKPTGYQQGDAGVPVSPKPGIKIEPAPARSIVKDKAPKPKPGEDQ